MILLQITCLTMFACSDQSTIRCQCIVNGCRCVISNVLSLCCGQTTKKLKTFGRGKKNRVVSLGRPIHPFVIMVSHRLYCKKQWCFAVHYLFFFLSFFVCVCVKHKDLTCYSTSQLTFTIVYIQTAYIHAYFSHGKNLCGMQ